MPIDPNQLDAAVRAADLSAGSAPLSDADLAAQLNVGQPTLSYQPIPLATLEAYLLTNSLVTPLQQIAADQTVDATLRAGLSDFLTLLASLRVANLGYDDPTIRGRTQAVLAALVPLGRGLTQAHADAIAAMGTVTTWAYGDVVQQADVTASRRRLAIAALVAKGEAVWSAFLSSTINPAANDATKPLPVWADFMAAVTAAGG